MQSLTVVFRARLYNVSYTVVQENMLLSLDVLKLIFMCQQKALLCLFNFTHPPFTQLVWLATEQVPDSFKRPTVPTVTLYTPSKRHRLVSDARLFCKNKQVNLKNKPKISNLTENQAQHALAWKFNKTKNQQENLIKKQWGKSQKTCPKWTNLQKTRPIGL